MTRSSARVAAMQLLYEKLLGGEGVHTLSVLLGFIPSDTSQACVYNQDCPGDMCCTGGLCCTRGLGCPEVHCAVLRAYEEECAYINSFIQGVSEHAEELDTLIARHSPTREPGRIARVDLCILRLALWELRYAKETPESVVINEAVEMAKRYSEPASARFINGVLGAIVREEAPQ